MTDDDIKDVLRDAEPHEMTRAGLDMAADEIERLEKLLSIATFALEARDENKDKEIERLREILKEVTDDLYESGGQHKISLDSMWYERAMEAIKESSDE